MKVIVQRDSVCAGDDMDAPHEFACELSPDAMLQEVLELLAARRFLPSVAGTGQWWQAIINDRVICRFEKDMTGIDYAVSPIARLQSFAADGDRVVIRLRYHSSHQH